MNPGYALPRGAYAPDWTDVEDRQRRARDPRRRLFWRVADDLDYLLTLVRLRILDALAGALPQTTADRQRQRTDGVRSTVIDYGTSE